MATNVNLPPGFQLDQQQSQSSLPPGFQLDETPVTQPKQKPNILKTGYDLAKKGYNLTLPGIMTNYMKPIQNAANVAGEKTAEFLGSKQVNPILAASIGTAIQMAPDITTSIAGSVGASRFKPLVMPKVGKKALEGTGRALAGGVEKVTGIPAENTMAAFKEPTKLFTAPTQNKVSAAYAKSEFPELDQDLETIINKGTSSAAGMVKRGANAIREFVDTGVQKTEDIFRGRQGLDKQISLLKNQIQISKQGGKAALQNALDAKMKLREMFNRALDKMAPKLREADKLASERFKVAPFRNITLPGKINLLSPEGILRSVPGLPTAVGAAVSGAGAVGKGISEATSLAPRLIAPVMATTNKTKILDESTALKLLDETNGDVEKARQLATQRGYRIPINTQNVNQ